MFSISVESSFKASHELVLPDGSREELHDHDWQVKVTVSRDGLCESGFVMDFHLLKKKVDNITAEISDMTLEDSEHFCDRNASAENVACHIYEKLSLCMPKEVYLECVEIVEEPGCVASYRK